MSERRFTHYWFTTTGDGMVFMLGIWILLSAMLFGSVVL